MTKTNIHNKLHYYLALIIAFSLPLAKLTPIFIALMFLNWIIEGDFKNKYKTVIHNKIALLFISFYILHIIGLSYTQNIPAGLFDIQVKLSLLLFPLILSSKPISEYETKHVFIALIAGGLISSIIMLSRASYLYINSGENAFFYQSFSIVMHPSYLAMYLNVALAWLLINLTKNKFITNRNVYLYSTLIVILFSIVIVILSSKSGMITLFLTLVTFLSYLTIYKKKYITGVIATVCVILFAFFIYHFSDKTVQRIKYSLEAFDDSNLKNNRTTESTSLRILIWKASTSIIKNNFLAGVGTGDCTDELMKEYAKRKIDYGLVNNLNAHNQFYQTFIGLGIVGFTILLATLLLPTFYAFKSSNFIYLTFLLIIIFNFLSESMLETQAGVMFYAFFNSLLCFNNRYSTINDTL